MAKEPRILLVRTDKIGDVVLTTPAIAALRKKYPHAHLVGLVSVTAAEVYAHSPHLNASIVLDPEKFGGFWGFWRLVGRLRRERCTGAVVFQARFQVALAILLSGIPLRVGPYSKWWSWICFNRGRRQNRSAVEMHEADYNIQLLKEFGIHVADAKEKTHLQVSEENSKEALRFFVEKGLSPRYKTVVIHPGMAGSALNWPEGHYVALARRLIQRYHIIVTGGPGEDALVENVFQAIARQQTYESDQPMLTKYIGDKGLGATIALFQQCDGVVAPSTGPMHLAVALGKKVVSVFPPIKVQSAVRWGPYGVGIGTHLGISSGDQASVLVPDVTCGEDFHCALQACLYYPCMPRVSVEDVEAQVVALLEGGPLKISKGASFHDWEEFEENE